MWVALCTKTLLNVFGGRTRSGLASEATDKVLVAAGLKTTY